MAKILIIEDDETINLLIKRNLELVGHSCFSVYDGEAALCAVESKNFDLLILDIMLPKSDGFQVIQRLKKELPVIFLTARGGVYDRIKGLQLGADDYIVKPFDMMELQARVESVLRRVQKQEEIFELGDVRVDFSARQVFCEGQYVDFTPQEFLLIETLIKNRNIALSREQLLEIAWGYDYYGETRTIDVHIHNIRKKLSWGEVIITVYKLGYRLEVAR